MKRSEMVNYLAMCLDASDLPGEWTQGQAKRAADYLLTKLESKDMRPPPYEDVLLGNHMDFYEINEWESEDDETN